MKKALVPCSIMLSSCKLFQNYRVTPEELGRKRYVNI